VLTASQNLRPSSLWSCFDFFGFVIGDAFVKTSKLLVAVIPALDNNTQGQAAAGIQ
jgi:hypothetical protein